MDKKKFDKLKYYIEQKKYVIICLYTAQYIIKYRNNAFTIQLLNSPYIHTYSSLSEMFQEFTIYGDSLVELFNEIKIME